MYTVYRGVMPVATHESRAEAVQAARSMSEETNHGVRVMHRDRVEMLQYRRGKLLRAERLTRPDIKRGRKLSLPS